MIVVTVLPVVGTQVDIEVVDELRVDS
jgi:hypothetical protein